MAWLKHRAIRRAVIKSEQLHTGRMKKVPFWRKTGQNSLTGRSLICDFGGCHVNREMGHEVTYPSSFLHNNKSAGSFSWWWSRCGFNSSRCSLVGKPRLSWKRGSFYRLRRRNPFHMYHPPLAEERERHRFKSRASFVTEQEKNTTETPPIKSLASPYELNVFFLSFSWLLTMQFLTWCIITTYEHTLNYEEKQLKKK